MTVGSHSRRRRTAGAAAAGIIDLSPPDPEGAAVLTVPVGPAAL